MDLDPARIEAAAKASFFEAWKYALRWGNPDSDAYRKTPDQVWADTPDKQKELCRKQATAAITAYYEAI